MRISISALPVLRARGLMATYAVVIGMFSANAQSLGGVVTDTAGIPVPGARITVFSTDTLQFREVRSNGDGGYWVEDLPGDEPFYVFGIAAQGYAYVEETIVVSVDTLIKDVQLSVEVHPGVWDIIMESPEPLGGTDLGVLLPDGGLYYCHNTKDPFLFYPEDNDTMLAAGHEQVQGCVAPALLSDGRIFFAGGTLQKIYGPGTNKVKTFDPVTGLWEYQPDLLDYRWYPTLAPLYDGKLLIVGGGGLDNPKRVKTSEVYDPESGETVAADTVYFGNEVSPIVPLYNGKILMTHRPPQLFDPASMRWEVTSDFVQGNRLPNGDHSDHELVLLPDGNVLAVGYKSFIPGEPGTLLEFYHSATETWSLGKNFDPVRSRAKTALLPDGRVLVMGGFKEDPGDPTPVNAWGYMDLTDLYDPGTDSWRRLNNMNRAREYHAITALVPDGRLIAVGGEGAPGNEPPQSIIEAFSPPYLFRGVRPVITDLSASVFQRGGSIRFETAKTEALTAVRLISHGVLTHFMNSGNNRFIDLAFVQDGNTVTAFLPSDSLVLMPGWYMLFGMVDDIPSVGQTIRVRKEMVVTSVPDIRLSQAFSVNVFPNPVTGVLYVEFQGEPADGLVRIDLLQMSGQPVRVLYDAGSASSAIEVPIPPGIPSGMYLLRVMAGGTSVVRKIVL